MTYPDGSPAEGVQVRVKAELTPKDNIYTSELVSINGKATFEIPSIPTAAQYVWLEVSGRDLEIWWTLLLGVVKGSQPSCRFVFCSNTLACN